MKRIFTFDDYTIECLDEQKFRLSKEIRDMDFPTQRFPQAYFADMQQVLHFLSMFYVTEVQISSMVIEEAHAFVEFTGGRELENLKENEFAEAFGKMLSMRRELLTKYVSSCSTFHSAMLLADTSYSVAFVLLVIAAESLSNAYYSKGSHFQKFKKLFMDFLPRKRRFLPSETRYADKKRISEEADVLFDKLIKAVYERVRSGFVHFGEESPVPSIIADRFQLAYMKTIKNHHQLRLWKQSARYCTQVSDGLRD